MQFGEFYSFRAGSPLWGCFWVFLGICSPVDFLAVCGWLLHYGLDCREWLCGVFGAFGVIS